MLHGCRLTTFLIVIVLFNPRQIVSGTQKTRDRNQKDDLPANPVVHRDKTNPEKDGTAGFQHAEHHRVHKQEIQKKQVNEEYHLGRHHNNINSRSNPEKDGEIHLKGMDRHVQRHRQEREDFSGDVHGHRAEIRGIHNHIHKTDRTREAVDDEDHQFSGETKGNEKHLFHHMTPRGYKHDQLNNIRANSDWEHSEKHLHSHRKKGSNGEFAYLTEDDKTVLPEENNDRALSGNREYDHVQKHREMSHMRTPRDSHVENARDVDDDNSGEKQVHRKVRQLKKTRDFHVDRKQTDQQMEGEDDDDDEGESSAEEEERVFKRRDVHLLSGEKRKENESGEIEESSRGKQESISDRNDEVKRFHSRDTREEKKVRLDLYQPKSTEKGQSSGSEHSSTKKSKAYRSINPVHLSKELNNDDFYITENDEPHEKPNIVEMRNFEEGNEIVGEDKEPIANRAQNLDEGVEAVQKFSRGPLRHLLQFGNQENSSLGYRPASSIQCSHPSFPDKIPDDEIIYIREECRLCQCIMGELTCEPNPELCAELRDKKPCFMVKGEAMADGERHFDGCNNCLCRNGELLCTRARCPLANYNYTNYRAIINNILNNTSNPDVYEGPIRGKDPCMECDYDPNSLVCGPNWKTYRSMCHAMYCGGHKIEHVKQGACEALNPCDEAFCAEHEICLIRRRGPCLATTTTDGNMVECRQYQCVNPSQDCGSVLELKVCGEDHITHSNECAMLARGVALAYYGPCNEECLGDDPRMCGVDGVTFSSSCHVTLLNSHVDYPGECDEVDPQYNIIMRSSDLYYNRRCKAVKELARCRPIDCKQHVIPEGNCCPVCGTSISIRLDTSAKDMTTLKTPEQPPFYQLNRIALIYNTLKTLSNQFESFDKCHLTADLVDTNDISVVYEPIKIKDEVACAQVAGKTVARINSPTKDDVDPGQALLAAAVVVNHSDPTFVRRVESMTSMAKKRRKKRSQHHEHEPFYNQNERICPQAIVVFFFMVVGLYCSSNLAEF